MEEKNIALLGFVSSAADYLREQIKDDGEEIKTLEEVDLNKIKSELENKLGSSFDGAKNKSDDLINAGREVFDNFISKSPTLIDEFKDIFDVDFKKENDEKDEEIVSHLINILKRPQENDETDDLVNQIAKAASEASLDYKSKVVVNNTCEDKELDSIFSEILANENTEEELPESDDKNLEEEKIDSNPEAKLDPNEIKQLIKDTISEFFNDKKQEKEIKLDEVIDSFDVLKNVSENNEQRSLINNEDIVLEEVKYEELNPNDFLDGVFKKVDSDIEEDKENATIEDVFVDDEVNNEQTAAILNVSDDTVKEKDNHLVNYESSYEEPVKKEKVIDEEIVLNDFNVEEAIEKEFLEIQNRKANIEETKKTNDDDYAFVDGVLVNDADLIEKSKVIEEPLNSDVDEHEGIEEEQIEDKEDLEESEELDDEALADESSEDSISLFDDVPLSKKLTSFTDQYEASANPYYRNEDLSFDKDDEVETGEKEDSISSFLKELKENKEEDLSEETSGIIADLIDDKTINKETETENEPLIIENDYVEAYNNRTLEEMYIPNPGLNALENEVEDDSVLVEETHEETESNEDSYLSDLFDELTNNDFEVDDISDKQKQEEATKKEIFDSIVTLYPYLSNGFIKGVYDLKQSFVNDYKDGEKIIILHRLHFEDINGLRQFVDVMIEHGYLVNVDEKQMIVDTFKEHINSDGKILTDIFEIANQGKLLTGDYEGYRIIEDEL